MSAVDVLSENALVVRDATLDDVHAISSLYARHVLHGRASFEEVPPTIDEMRQRMHKIANDGLPRWSRSTTASWWGIAMQALTVRAGPTAILWKSLSMLTPV